MPDSSIEKQLSSEEFFSGFSPEYIKFLASCASKRHIEPKQIVVRHGEHASKFFLLCSGRIIIEVPAISGPSLEVQSLSPGEILGWSWLIAPYQWNFQARTEESTDVLEFDGEAILARCEKEPAFGYALFKCFSSLMSERMSAARRKMMDDWNPPGFA